MSAWISRPGRGCGGGGGGVDVGEELGAWVVGGVWLRNFKPDKRREGQAAHADGLSAEGGGWVGGPAMILARGDLVGGVE